jgi:hypothetical protein
MAGRRSPSRRSRLISQLDPSTIIPPETRLDEFQPNSRHDHSPPPRPMATSRTPGSATCSRDCRRPRIALSGRCCRTRGDRSGRKATARFAQGGGARCGRRTLTFFSWVSSFFSRFGPMNHGCPRLPLDLTLLAAGRRRGTCRPDAGIMRVLDCPRRRT